MNTPLTPKYILRGHASAIHSLHIFQHNLRLISADADGWIVVWDLVSKRPVAAWKGHEGAILQVRAFSLAEGFQVYRFVSPVVRLLYAMLCDKRAVLNSLDLTILVWMM